MKLLFVDDDTHVLQGLQRMLRRYGSNWDMRFASSGPEALQLMGRGHFDVIVSDVRMPGMDGIRLLSEIQERHPSTVRIVLSGHAGEDDVLRAVGPAHQYLSKPCDAEALRVTVERAFALRDILANETLKQLVARMTSLPSLPALYQDILAELRSEEPSLRTLGEIVSQDVAMTAKVLQLVNSAFFGLPSKITDAVQAVMHLGMDTVRALSLSAAVFTQLEDSIFEGLDLETLWAHSARTATLAKRIAYEEKASKEIVDASYQAGFLHDIGKLVLAANLPVEYAKALALSGRRQVAAPWAVEREILGAAHAEVGGYLLGIWGLPDLVVEAVTFHHEPSRVPTSGFSPLVAVHVADSLDRESSTGSSKTPCDQSRDQEYLGNAGLSGRLEKWSEACKDLLTDGETS